MKNIVSFLQAIQRILTTGCISLRCGTVPAWCKFGGYLPFLCGILGLDTSWMVPSPFFYSLWSEVQEEFIDFEKQKTPQEDAKCRSKLSVVQTGRRVKCEPVFDTDRSSFFPCILHLMMICGKLILSFRRTNALELPKGRVLLMKVTFKAAKESAPDGGEVQRLFHAWHTVAHILSIGASAADESVCALCEGFRELYDSGPPVDGLARFIVNIHHEMNNSSYEQ